MTIREVINILIDEPDKDKPFLSDNKAKWIDDHDLSKCYCSKCNVRFADALRIPLGNILNMPISPTAFCPNCGAKMRGGD